MLSNRSVWIGYAAGLSAAVSYGAAQTLGKHITTEYAVPLVATAFALLFGFIYVSIMFSRHIAADLGKSPRKSFIFFGVSGVFSSAGVLSMYFALSKAPLVMVSPIFAINPLITLLLAHIFLNKLEKITTRTVLGTILVVSGVSIITLSGSFN